MTDDKQIEMDAHFAALKSLYQRAAVNEENFAAVIGNMNQTNSVIHEASRNMPGVVATKVREEIAKSIDNAANKIIQRQSEANTKAVEATKSYSDSINFSFLRLGLFTAFGLTLSMLICGAVAYYVLPNILKELREEEARMVKNIEVIKKYGGTLVVYECKSNNGVEFPCIVTIDQNESDRVYGENKEIYRRIKVDR